MVTNEAGQIALRRLRVNPYPVKVNGKMYLFQPRNNVNICWVDPEDVQAVLNVKYSCCGNSAKQQFYLATEDVIRIYNQGSC